jgi:hypothetical protein
MAKRGSSDAGVEPLSFPNSSALTREWLHTNPHALTHARARERAHSKLAALTSRPPPPPQLQLAMDVQHPDGEVPDTCVTSYRAQLLDAVTGLPLPGCAASEAKQNHARAIDGFTTWCDGAAIVPPTPDRPLRVIARVTAANRRSSGNDSLDVPLRITRVIGPSSQLLKVCRETEAPSAPTLAAVWLTSGAATPSAQVGRDACCMTMGCAELAARPLAGALC